MIDWLILGMGALVTWFLWESHYRQTSPMAGGLHSDIALPHKSTWELYHNDFSLCSKKMRVCLAELGIQYTSHHIDLIETGAYENISRHYLRVNPAALVPVLVHNGHPVYESHEQLVYAAAHADDPLALVPQDARKRALMDLWVHKTAIKGDPLSAMDDAIGNTVPGLTLPVFATMITAIPYHRILEGLLFHRFKERAMLFLLLKLRGPARLPNTAPMTKVIRRSFRAAIQHLQELETCLEQSGGPYIVGEQFTLADVGMVVIFDRIDEADWQSLLITDERPLVKAYAAVLRQRSSYVTALEDHRHPTVTTGTERIVALKKENTEFRKLYEDCLAD